MGSQREKRKIIGSQGPQVDPRQALLASETAESLSKRAERRKSLARDAARAARVVGQEEQDTFFRAESASISIEATETLGRFVIILLGSANNSARATPILGFGNEMNSERSGRLRCFLWPKKGKAFRSSMKQNTFTTDISPRAGRLVVFQQIDHQQAVKSTAAPRTGRAVHRKVDSI